MVAIHALQLEPEDWDDLDGGPAAPTVTVPTRPRAAALSRPTADQIRRRRLVALLGAAAVVVLLVVGVQTVFTEQPAEVPVRPLSAVDPDGVYVVQQGDTLWTIAERLAPGEDPRPLVAELRERLGNVALEVGDRIDLGDGAGRAG